MASTEDNRVIPRVLLQTDKESLDLVMSNGQKTLRHVTIPGRYDKYDVIADLGGPAKPVIPTPLAVRHQRPQRWIDIGTDWTILHQRELVYEARLLSG